MKINKETILSWNPCGEWTDERIENLIKKYCGRRKNITFDDIVKSYKNNDILKDDFLWLVLRPYFIPDEQLHKIAIFCWEKIAKPIWEKYYPHDKRPHEAIRVKKLWLDGKASDKELSAARAAARDAAGDAAGEKIIKYIIRQMKNLLNRRKNN